MALVGDRIAVISQYGKAELLEVDLTTGATTAIDLSMLADDDGQIMSEEALLSNGNADGGHIVVRPSVKTPAKKGA